MFKFSFSLDKIHNTAFKYMLKYCFIYSTRLCTQAASRGSWVVQLRLSFNKSQSSMMADGGHMPKLPEEPTDPWRLLQLFMQANLMNPMWFITRYWKRGPILFCLADLSINISPPSLKHESRGGPMRDDITLASCVLVVHYDNCCSQTNWGPKWIW